MAVVCRGAAGQCPCDCLWLQHSQTHRMVTCRGLAAPASSGVSGRESDMRSVRLAVIENTGREWASEDSRAKQLMPEALLSVD